MEVTRWVAFLADDGGAAGTKGMGGGRAGPVGKLLP